MIIEKNITPYIVFSEDDLNIALKKITENKHGFVFVVSSNGILQGVLTDGDFRRWLLSTQNYDLSQPSATAINSNCISASIDASNDQLDSLLSQRVKQIPLLDTNKRVCAVALHSKTSVEISGFSINNQDNSFIIAEIGNNHNGDIKLAKKLVDRAVDAGANCAKFQIRNLNEAYRKNASNSEDLGAEYTIDLLKRFQLPDHEMLEVFQYCKTKNIIPLCTPWDPASVDLLEDYGMAAYKVASADLTNHDLLKQLAKTRKPLICSTGMSTEEEIQKAVNLLESFGTQYILLHCNSTYPAPFKDINLSYIERLKKISSLGLVGYSGHERGYSVAIAAVALGAKVIEKHFTLDRSMEGNDHKVSLLPEEFKLMVQGIREVEEAIGSKERRQITQGELMNREVLGKSLVAKNEIPKGTEIKASDIDIRGPGRGLSPYKKDELIGKVARRDVYEGDFFYDSDLGATKHEPKNYKFSHRFGIPVRYHDFNSLIKKSNFDLIEFHHSYRDLDLDPGQFLNKSGYDMDLLVHSPELFAGDHILDLSSTNETYRSHSIAQLQKVVDVTRSLKYYFRDDYDPLIIVNAGGFTQDAFMSTEQRSVYYRRVADSLRKIDQRGVEIIIQTMPPFPWHFGGQRYHNLFMEAEEIVEFCQREGIRICLDLSHSKLLCNHMKVDFYEFVKKVAPYTAHLHIVDAKGTDGEGLQLGEGEIYFPAIFEILNERAPEASFIPEIWQGHKNNGEGFWQALEAIEQMGF